MISKSSEYAIRALVYIELQNRKGKTPGFKEIAKEIDAPEPFTGKIMQTLTRHELLKSMKGRGGGFYFDKESGSLSLYEVVRTTEGEKFFRHCIFGLKNCSDEKPCPVHEKYAAIRDEFTLMFQNETIQSLADKISEGKAVLSRQEGSFVRFKTS
jgi:Rrf2 family protein